MIIEEVFNYRHWAETARLYTGWLDKEEQSKFIKSLAVENILLAAECRANLFFEDLEIDNYLAEIAVENTEDISKTKMTANGLLALAVLDKYEKILNIFESKKAHSNESFYTSIISDFIGNASEHQTLEFLKILSSSNIFLFGKALDNILENSIVFTQDSKKVGQLLLSNFDTDKHYLLKLKIICLFHLTHLLEFPQDDLYKLIDARLWKYAWRLSNLFVFEIDIDVLHIITELIEEKKSQDIKLLLKILQISKLNFEEGLINMVVSKSLNPIVKKLALTNLNGDLIDNDLALKICQENIKIGNISSIQFADEVMNLFKLDTYVNKEELIIRLLKSHKYLSIKLAYQLIKKYSLYNIFNFRIVLEILIGKITNESLILARELVLEEFPVQERDELLTYICILSLKDEKFTKIRKQILLNDLNQIHGKDLLNHEFNGLVANTFKGHYQIYLGHGLPNIQVPYTQMRLKKNQYYKFRFSGSSQQLSELQILFVSKHPLYEKAHKIWYGNFYIGQMLDINITLVTLKAAFGIAQNSNNLKFVVPISEIDNLFVKDVAHHIEVKKSYKIKIKNFNRNKGEVICSLKDLKIETHTQFNNKLELLKEKYHKAK